MFAKIHRIQKYGRRGGGDIIDSNIYILYCLTHKTEQVQRVLKRHGIVSYIPRMEKYIRSIDKVVDDVVMFPGYLFVESDLDQADFTRSIRQMNDEKNGIIRELKDQGVSALTEEEKEFYHILFDDHYLLKMSYITIYAYLMAVTGNYYWTVLI